MHPGPSYGGHEQRQDIRYNLELPAEVRIGTQFALKGTVKDLSMKSAFIRLRNSVYIQVNDEVGFSIFPSGDEEGKDVVAGQARVSRLVPGEGIAIYFTDIDGASGGHLKKLIKV
ncbi:MAG: PilZ domain-containing protein [Elusimicrobia bacterium]|nr:PilZ domain-containing protein [Elusimicrobiota bacterium]